MTPRTPPEIGGMGHSVKRKEDPASSGARGPMSTTSSYRACSTSTLCAAPMRTPRSRTSTRQRPWPFLGSWPITGEDLAKYNLHWMPTLMSDTQMVLPVEKVMYQAQEVAAVLATDLYTAADGVAAVEVAYEPPGQWSIPSRPAAGAPAYCARTNRARRTTASSTGRLATKPPLIKPSATPR